MPRRRLLIAASGLALMGVACGDGAAGGTYRGEPLFTFDLVLNRLGAADATGELALAVRWGGVDAGLAPLETLALRPGVRVVAIHDPVPAALLEAAAQGGALVVGEVLAFDDGDGDARLDPGEPLLGASVDVIAFSPDGARGAPAAASVPAGFSRVRPAAPCDDVALVVFQADFAAPLTVEGGRPSRADPACAARLVPGDDSCPSLTDVRHLCRHTATPPEALCDRCLWLVFPQGADAATCDRWGARCEATDVVSVTRDTCQLELAVCHAGEPPALDDCDLACACARFEAACRTAAGGSAEICAAKAEGCDWREAAGRGGP